MFGPQQPFPSKGTAIFKAFLELVGLWVIIASINTIALTIGLLVNDPTIQLLLVTLTALLSGLMIYTAAKHDSTSKKVIFGIFAPIPAVKTLVIGLTILQKLTVMMQDFAHAIDELALPIQGIISVPNLTIFSPILLGVIFYSLSNIFILINLIREKKYLPLLWFLLAILFFFIFWFVADMFTVPDIAGMVGLEDLPFAQFL